MTSSFEFDEAPEADPSLFENHISACDHQDIAARSMRILERLASTLGVPIATFFDANIRTTPQDEAGATEIADLTRAFRAITDPVTRRNCLEVIRAAGGDRPSEGPSPTDA